MSSWSVNNRSATTTWLTLKLLAQIPKNEVFKDSGKRKMDELLFWNKSSSEKIRKIQAESLSIMIDNIFRDIRGAVYEDGIDGAEAVEEIRTSLLDKNITIEELAEIIDQNYLFWGEEKDV